MTTRNPYARALADRLFRQRKVVQKKAVRLIPAKGSEVGMVEVNEKFLKVLEPLEQQVEMLQASISAIKSQLMLSDRRYIAQMTDDYLENHFSPGLTE
jgi:hypothetical protein